MHKPKSLVIAAVLILFISCSKDNIAGSSEENSKPSEIEVTANIIGSDQKNPYGDGSGTVIFSINAANADSYRVRIDDEILEVTDNTISYKFSHRGTKTYSIVVLAYNSYGFSHISYDITVYVYREEKLVWSDEFDVDGQPNPNKWTYNIGNGGNGWGNNESQYYTKRPENVTINNGLLKITAKRENYNGHSYTSTRMLTRGLFEFTYGRVVARAKLPLGGGTWPAIWMLGANFSTVGWPACGEIDIMEHVGNNQGKIHGSIHNNSSYGATVNTGTKYVSDVSSEFHLYSVNWTEEEISFFIDDNLFYTYRPNVQNDATWPFDKDHFIILNLAMGGTFGGAIDPEFSESSLEIDYIRVYQ